MVGQAARRDAGPAGPSGLLDQTYLDVKKRLPTPFPFFISSGNSLDVGCTKIMSLPASPFQKLVVLAFSDPYNVSHDSSEKKGTKEALP